MKLTVIVPVYNEDATLLTLMDRVNKVDIEKEIIVVDDGSNELTKDLFSADVFKNCKLITHQQNQGKGAAVCTALSHASGEIAIIQDADLEYFPEDYIKLIQVYREKNAKAVYGVRDLRQKTTVMRWGNRFLTLITNILYGASVSDMETCYKLVDVDLMKSLNLTSRGFEIEAEITSKLLLNSIKIFETPIQYQHRTTDEGKKLTVWDGIPTLLTLIKNRWRYKNLKKAAAAKKSKVSV